MQQADIAVYLKGWNAPVFSGLPHENMHIWFSKILLGLKQRHVPRENWVHVASHFLGEELQEVLDGVANGIEKLETGEDSWNWDRFTCALILIHDRVKKDAVEASNPAATPISQFRAKHPVATAAAAIGLITLGGIAVGPAVLVGTLNLLGFSSAGVVGGSIAAEIQSAVYGGYVASGSAFALAQSAAAGGIIVASVPIQAISAGAMAVGAWIGFGHQASNDDNHHSSATFNPRVESASKPVGDNNTAIWMRDERSGGGQ